MPRSLRLFVFARHGESVLNLERRINGDPAKEVDLTERGRFEAARLGEQLAGLRLDVCLHTRFPRAARTHEIPIRYALNAAAGSDTLDGPAHELPNAAPFLFDEDGLQLAVAGIDRLVGTVPA